MNECRPPKLKRRRYQVSLRTLFVVNTSAQHANDKCVHGTRPRLKRVPAVRG